MAPSPNNLSRAAGMLQLRIAAELQKLKDVGVTIETDAPRQVEDILISQLASEEYVPINPVNEIAVHNSSTVVAEPSRPMAELKETEPSTTQGTVNPVEQNSRAQLPSAANAKSTISKAVLKPRLRKSSLSPSDGYAEEEHDVGAKFAQFTPINNKGASKKTGKR